MSEVSRAAEALRAGDLVAFPTETVYGLGADASNPDAVAKIFAAKGRPPDHPLIVHLPDASHLSRWAHDVPDIAYRLAASYWPGPLTLILRRQASVIDAITGGQDTVGLRVPNHPLALELLSTFDGGIAGPSANRFGHVSPTSARHVRDEFGAAVPIVLDGGACRVGIESTILDLSSEVPRILRPGMIGIESLAKTLGQSPVVGARTDSPRVSGSLESHYAPSTRMTLADDQQLAAVVGSAVADGQRVVVYSPTTVAGVEGRVAWRACSRDPEEYAHSLYADLRSFDALGVDLIVVACPPANEAWRAVNDRLKRASAEVN